MKPDARIATPIDAPCQIIRFVLEGQNKVRKEEKSSKGKLRKALQGEAW